MYFESALNRLQNGLLFYLGHLVIYGEKPENQGNPDSFRENPDNFGKIGIFLNESFNNKLLEYEAIIEQFLFEKKSLDFKVNFNYLFYLHSFTCIIYRHNFVRFRTILLISPVYDININYHKINTN
jgi:hypothetical protein